MNETRNQSLTGRNYNSVFEDRDGVLVCVKRALSDARRAYAANAARKGWRVNRKSLKAMALENRLFHVY